MMILRIYLFINQHIRVKKGKFSDYVAGWKSKGVYTSKLKPLYTAFLHTIKFSGYKVRKKFDKDPLAVEQSNYAAKVVDTYIVFDLDTWPNNLLRNFTLKNCLFGATSMVKSSDREKWVYSGYGIAFDGKGTGSFGNEFCSFWLLLPTPFCIGNIPNEFGVTESR